MSSARRLAPGCADHLTEVRYQGNVLFDVRALLDATGADLEVAEIHFSPSELKVRELKIHAIR
jgi:hypothetical protein